MQFSEHIRHLSILFAVSIATFFLHNGVILPDIMECRNLVTAREMVETGNYLSPTMNGEPRLEKPPLPTWIAAAIEQISPDNLPLQRAAAGVAATLLLFFFYFLGRLLTGNGRYALYASLVLCTSYSLILMGRTATWDIYCHAFMMGALYYLTHALLTEGRHWGDFIAVGLFFGLSFLSKGPVSFYALLLPYVITLLLLRTGNMRGKWRSLLLAVGIFLLIGGSWYVMMLHAQATQTEAVISQESSAWVNHNVRPWWYYWDFFLETGVWSLMLLTALAIPCWKRKTDDAKRMYLLPVIWLAVQLVLLSCIPEKKPRYLLPILVPAAYAIGYLFTLWQQMSLSDKFSRTAKGLFSINAVLVAVVTGLLLPAAMYKVLYVTGAMSGTLYASTSMVLVAIALYIGSSVRKNRPLQFLYGVVALFIMAEVVLMPYVGYISNNRERTSIRAVRNMPSLNGIPFYYNAAQKEPRIEIVYEAGRRIRPLDMTDSATVARALPFALLSHGEATAEIPCSALPTIRQRHIGRFDDNQRQKTAHRYSPMFIYHLTLLEVKTNE